MLPFRVALNNILYRISSVKACCRCVVFGEKKAIQFYMRKKKHELWPSLDEQKHAMVATA